MIFSINFASSTSKVYIYMFMHNFYLDPLKTKETLIRKTGDGPYSGFGY